MRPGRLRQGISTRSIVVTSAAARGDTQNPLVQISVRGPWDGDTTAQAANLLAGEVIQEVSGYVDQKIDSLEERLQAQNRELQVIDRRIDQLSRPGVEGLSGGERLVLAGLSEQRRGQLLEERTDTEQLLTLAETVERGKQVTEAQAQEVPAQSPRSSIFVGALIGLIAGIALALLWDPLVGRRRRAGLGPCSRARPSRSSFPPSTRRRWSARRWPGSQPSSTGSSSSTTARPTRRPRARKPPTRASRSSTTSGTRALAPRSCPGTSDRSATSSTSRA